MSQRKKPKRSQRRPPSAAREHEPAEGKHIGQTDGIRGAEQRGPGMNKGRGAAGPLTEA
jgi:hypothetical protein